MVGAAVEYCLVHNPLRKSLVKRTLSLLSGMAQPAAYGDILEIGCGEGTTASQLISLLRPRSYEAFDIDGHLVHRARQRLAARHGAVRIRLWTSDSSVIDAEAGSYDLVVALNVLHHIPDWRGVLREVRRVLRPRGSFLFEVLCREYYASTPFLRHLLQSFVMPNWSRVFDYRSFCEGLHREGFSIERSERHFLPGWHYGVAVCP